MQRKRKSMACFHPASLWDTWVITAFQFENRKLFLNLWRAFRKTDCYIKYRSMVLFIPWNIWGNHLLYLGGWNYCCYKTCHYKPRLMLQANNVKLLMLVSEFTINSRLKSTRLEFLLNTWNVLTRMLRRKIKIGHLLQITR